MGSVPCQVGQGSCSAEAGSAGGGKEGLQQGGSTSACHHLRHPQCPPLDGPCFPPPLCPPPPLHEADLHHRGHAARHHCPCAHLLAALDLQQLCQRQLLLRHQPRLQHCSDISHHRFALCPSEERVLLGEGLQSA